MLAALALFLVFVGVGLLSEARGGDFARVILGDAYVNMTIANVERGEPMGVYAQMDEAPMALAITMNNVRVSFLAFVGGIVGGVGTLFLLLYNGVMVGSFHGFLAEQGVLGPAMLSIWTHGTLELTAIALAGGAGFAVARGMLFPGTLPRSVSFARGARSGVRLIVGLVPVFVAAGFMDRRLPDPPRAALSADQRRHHPTLRRLYRLVLHLAPDHARPLHPRRSLPTSTTPILPPTARDPRSSCAASARSAR